MASLSLNKVFLAGNLTRDPEVRFTPSGMAVADIGLAVNESYKDTATNEWKEKPVFVDVVVWGRQAQSVGEYLTKGSPVLIEGRLQLDQWETQQGEKRSKMRVNAQRVQFVGSPNRGKSGGDGGTPSGSGDRADSAGQASAPAPESDSPPAAAAGDEDNLPF
ncbi:MAG: single-stranded DNA-binding protein [Kiritimatiellae bacterium]|nr:single-stranded DNA-binding protein [Kiritimatiellia bacterium]